MIVLGLDRGRGCASALALFLLIVLNIDPRATAASTVGASTSEHEASAGCTISVSPIDFGVYDPTARSPAVSVGTITYRCLDRRPAGIKIALVSGQLDPAGIRYMVSSSGERLRFLLCLDPNCIQPWGDGSFGTGVYNDPNPPISTDVSISIFGLLPAQQSGNAARGYHNSITVIATF